MFVCSVYVKGMLQFFVLVFFCFARVKYVSRVFAGLFVTASCVGHCRKVLRAEWRYITGYISENVLNYCQNNVTVWCKTCTYTNKITVKAVNSNSGMQSRVSHAVVINSSINLFVSSRKIELFLTRCSKRRETYYNCKIFAFLRRRTEVTHEAYAVFPCQRISKTHDFNLNVFFFFGYKLEGHV